MSHFQPCLSCACHVRREDPLCPFCGAPNAPRRDAISRAPRTSRAQWLALGTTVALLGCTGTIAPEAEHDGGTGAVTHADTGVGPTPDSGKTADASVGGDPGAVCASRSGFFSCGANVCDRAIQVCDKGNCTSYGDLSSLEQPDLEASTSCGSCPTCECLQGKLYPNCYCVEDDEGSIAVSCGGCYGSPPARLERLS